MNVNIPNNHIYELWMKYEMMKNFAVKASSYAVEKVLENSQA